MSEYNSGESAECSIDDTFSLYLKKENDSFDSSKNIILLTFDDNYVNQTINMILSISKFHKKEVSYICLCPVLKQENVNKLLDLDEGVQIHSYNFQNIVAPEKWPACAMFRLFAPWLLDETIHKVLYLDSDIICKGSIEKLLNLETAYIAMCPEISGNINEYQQNKIQKYLPVQIYCNSGVCVFNLDSLRREYSFATINTALKNMSKDCAFPDQDFLNFFFRGKIEFLNYLLYNFQPTELKNSRVYKRTINNCRLIHFSASTKPWSHKGNIYLIKLYLKYTEYPPMQEMAKRALRKSYFHAIIRLNRPIQRWYYDTYLHWRKQRSQKK